MSASTRSFSLASHSLLAVAVLVAAISAARAGNGPSLDQPVQVETTGSWLQETVIRPVAPFELVPGKDANA